MATHYKHSMHEYISVFNYICNAFNVQYQCFPQKDKYAIKIIYDNQLFENEDIDNPIDCIIELMSKVCQLITSNITNNKTFEDVQNTIAYIINNIKQFK